MSDYNKMTRYKRAEANPCREGDQRGEIFITAHCICNTCTLDCCFDYICSNAFNSRWPLSREKAVPPAVLKNLEERYHTNDPLGKQYIDYMVNVAQFNLGPTFRYEGRSVNELIKDGLPKTATIGFLAAIFALGGGLILGSIAALWQNKTPDAIATFIATIGISVPSFVMATFLQYYLGYKLGLFPPVGWNDGAWRNLVLPSLALGAYPIAQITRLMRASMLDVLSQDYIRTAKSKGLPC